MKSHRRHTDEDIAETPEATETPKKRRRQNDNDQPTETPVNAIPSEIRKNNARQSTANRKKSDESVQALLKKYHCSNETELLDEYGILIFTNYDTITFYKFEDTSHVSDYDGNTEYYFDKIIPLFENKPKQICLLLALFIIVFFVLIKQI
jgi:hypothetical protein